MTSSTAARPAAGTSTPAGMPGRRHIVLAPDKFKGSLTAAAVADHLAVGIAAAAPGVQISRVPVADGGDGTVQAALAAGFRPVTVTVSGPLGQPVQATFGLGDGRALGAEGTRTAVLELATASGLGLLPATSAGPRLSDALHASSRGTGDLIRAALDGGARLVVLGVGGSACTDGGAGMLAALGVTITGSAGQALADGGAALGDLAAVDLTTLDPRVAGTRFVLASDVDNPLLGAGGAAAVFGPQKGASPEAVDRLAAGLGRWVAALNLADPTTGGLDQRAGAGAAGGVGYAALAVLRAEMAPGIDLVLDLVGLDDLLATADLCVTGEGSLDDQTLRGKAPVGVARLARRHGVDTVAVCGRSTLSAADVAAAGLRAVYALTDDEPDVARCIADPGPLLRRIGERIGRLLPPVPAVPPNG